MLIDWTRFGASGLVALCALSAASAAPDELASGLDRDGMNPAIRPQELSAPRNEELRVAPQPAAPQPGTPQPTAPQVTTTGNVTSGN